MARAAEAKRGNHERMRSSGPLFTGRKPLMPGTKRGSCYPSVRQRAAGDRVRSLYELRRTGGRYALVTMCIGSGQDIAAILERM